jgi:hypothetical protein
MQHAIPTANVEGWKHCGLSYGDLKPLEISDTVETPKKTLHATWGGVWLFRHWLSFFL